MRFVKSILKLSVVFILVFVVYSLIYHYKVQSVPWLDLESTFVASDEEISEVAMEGYEPISVPEGGFDESNIPKDGFFMRIDKIDLFKPVVMNVDPRYKEVYVESWEVGISHGKFTALPDQIGNTYFFAHAVSDASKMEENDAWFTEIDLLEENDEIIVYYSGKKYTYQVSRIYTVSPTATGVYTGVSAVPKITLQTCGPPRGSLSSRYMIEALQVDVEDY